MKSFNSSPVVPTPSLGDYSNNVVTSKWVKDVSTAAVYVSPDGDDSNSGFSAAESVKTFNRAIAVMKATSPSGGKIVAAAGSYTGGISLDRINCIVEMGGDISLSGKIYINSAKLWFDSLNDNTRKLTVSVSESSAIEINVDAFLFVYKLEINSTSTEYAIVSKYRGMIMGNSLNITISSSSGSNPAVFITHGSFFRFFTINISGTRGEFKIYTGSVAIIDSTLTINSPSSSNGIYVSHSSFLYCHGAATITVQSTCVFSSISSAIYFNSSVTGTNSASGGRAFLCSEYGLIHFQGTVTATPSSSVDSCFYVTAAALIGVYGNLSVSGTYSSQVVYCAFNSHFTLSANATVTNNATGKQYTVYTGGQLSVGGKGANRIPGTANTGTASSSQFAFYG